MFSTCNTACVDSLVLTPTTQCDVYQRSEVPVRFILATCDTDFPSGAYDDLVHATAFEALITAGNVTATFELADFVWADPTFTQKQYKAIRSPKSDITTGRTLTAKDYNATDVDNVNAAFPYFDRDFYKNVVQNKAVKIRGYVTDQGRIYLFLDQNGNFMSYSLQAFTGWDGEVEGQSVEFKNYVLTFVADPMISIVTPYLDLKLADPTDTLGIAWLYLAN
jgi:hypothetical protein